jgi:hypothetical protein
MVEAFDPYHKWLAIPPGEQPPNHYRLLGAQTFESDADVIANAADRQMAHVKVFQAGPHSAFSQKILNEIAAARVCLLNPQRKAEYDALLRGQLAAQEPVKTEDSTSGIDLGFDIPASPPIIAPPPTRLRERGYSWQPYAAIAAGAAVVVLIGAVLLSGGRKEQPAQAKLDNAESAPVNEGSAKSEQSDTPPIVAPDPPQPEPKKVPEPPIATPSTPSPRPVAPPIVAVESDFVSLFDGITLAGWHATGRGIWKVDDGAIVGRLSSAADDWGVLASDRDFDNFVLRMQVKMAYGNSGVYFRAREGGWAGVSGLQAELFLPHRIGALHWNDAVSPQNSRSIWDNPPDPLQAYWRQSEWNDVEISADGTKATIRINSTTTAEWDGTIGERTGKIALQLWRELTDVRFRRIRIRTASPSPISASASSKKLPVPDESAQEQARKLVQSVYKDKYDKATTPEAQSSLAQELLGKVWTSNEDTSAQYVLFKEAGRLAVSAKNVELALRVVNEIEAKFTIDAPTMKLGVVTTIGKSARLPEQIKAVVEKAFPMIEEAVVQEQFDTAEELGEATVEYARRSKDASLLKRAVARNKDLKAEIGELRALQVEVEKAQAVAKQNPNDPAANLALGKYFCFSKGQWDKGLPMLALGGDPALKDLAERELKGIGDAAERTKLGHAWWDLGEKESGLTKKHLRERALHLYRQSMPWLSGLEKERVTKRLNDAERDTQSEAPKSPKRTPRQLATRDSNDRSVFVGQWICPHSKRGTFIATLNEDNTASSSTSPGVIAKWEYVQGEARVTFSDGQRWIFRRSGQGFQKLWFRPGLPPDAPPTQVDWVTKVRS